MSVKTKEEMYQAIAHQMKDINEILAKSGYGMQKADEFQEEAPAPAPEEGMEAAPAPEEGGEFDEAPAPEEGMEGGEEGAGDEMEEMRAHAQELSDEELDMMLEILTSEQANRGSAQPEEGGEFQEAPEEGMESAPEDEFAEKSMKEDYAKMAKSLENVIGVVDKLAKTVAISAKRPAQSKPAATNRTQVLSKSTSQSAPKVERLSKSDSIEYCIGKIGESKHINSDVIATLNLTRSNEELHAVQDSLSKQGFEWPKN